MQVGIVLSLQQLNSAQYKQYFSQFINNSLNIMATQSFGIMDEGYFVSRKDIMGWINQVLALQISKIEQLGTGAIYCQLMDALCPGIIQMGKVNWKAKHEYEFILNFKILQLGFDKLGVTKKIDIQKLAKCKYQDNLELIQWIKRYIELEGGCREDYDASARRSGASIELPQTQSKHINKENNCQLKKTHLSTSNLLNSTIEIKKQINTKTLSTPRRALGARKLSLNINANLTTKLFQKTNNKVMQSIHQIEEEQEPDFI